MGPMGLGEKLLLKKINNNLEKLFLKGKKRITVRV